MKTNTLTHFQYRLALPNNGNATVRVEQKVNGVYQYLTIQQTQTTSGLYAIFLPMTACYAYRQSSLPFGSSPNQENIRISVNGTSGFALQQISLERDNVDTLVNTYLVSRGYRYGFQGQEKDDEIVGKGNNYTAEFWQYDSRLGRRWNIDPVVKYHESPYAAFANNPIWFIDPNGADTTLDEKSHTLIKDITNANSPNYNEKFANDFQKLVDDKTTVYSFEQWGEKKSEVRLDGSIQKVYGTFSAKGKNGTGQNLVNIGYTLETSPQGHTLDAFFEEFDHANQFLNQRIGFIESNTKWNILSYDFYDEVDNKIGRVQYLNNFKNGSQFKIELFGTNYKILKNNFSRIAASKFVSDNYDLPKTELNIFDAFQEPLKAKEAFNEGVRWSNILIGGE